jgi:hypothetical protein
MNRTQREKWKLPTVVSYAKESEMAESKLPNLNKKEEVHIHFHNSLHLHLVSDTAWDMKVIVSFLKCNATKG